MIEHLPDISNGLRRKLGRRLVSITLHGSLLKKAVAHDVDLLVIAKYLPEGWKERLDEVKPVKEEFLSKGIVLDIKLCTPEEFEDAMKGRNELIMSIAEHHETLYDTKNYFRNKMAEFKKTIAFEYTHAGDGTWEALKT